MMTTASRLQLDRVLMVALIYCFPCLAWAQDSVVIPLAQAHAHNDYWHDRPLADALDQGFCSVEADVFLVEGQLLVGHDRTELTPQRTLAKLYLDPLFQRWNAHSGAIFPDGPLFTLLVDIKADGEAAYKALEQELKDYSEMLCSYNEGEYHEGAVIVVVSGDRPKETMRQATQRLAFLDGRLSDLGQGWPKTLMPLVSDRWGSHFRWNGKEALDDAQRRQLLGAVKRVHDEGKRIRFWATPETTAAWQELSDAGVDHINTDRLEELSAFLNGKQR